MNHAQLHLVDATGRAVAPAVKSSTELAFRWVVRDFPNVDTAMIAEWAEEVGWAMEAKGGAVVSPDRYAYAALKGKVRDWLRTKPGMEESAGGGADLERLSVLDKSFQGKVYRTVLFEQLKASLNERDRYILVLLLQDETSPATVATALGTNYSAAAKAIQRVKERIAVVLVDTSRKGNFSQGTHNFCETKG